METKRSRGPQSEASDVGNRGERSGRSTRGATWKARAGAPAGARRAKHNRKLLSWRERMGSPGQAVRRVVGVARQHGRWFGALGAAVAMVATLALGYRFLTTSPKFAIAHVAITGNHELATAEIAKALGVGKGANLFLVNVDAAQHRVASLPWVQSVNVARVLPNQLRVTVVERKALAIAELSGSYYVDGTGHPFAAVGENRKVLPVITGVTRTEYQANVGATQAKLREALAVIATWQANQSRPAAEAVSLTSNTVIMQTEVNGSPIEIHLGEPDALAQRLATFDLAWAALADHEKARLRELRLDYKTDHLTATFETE
jgi:cell division protein FtsQ